jgi:hypothetical protein
MSFYRLIFYSAVIGGWAAFGGWLLGEAALLHNARDVGWITTLITAAFVGAAVAGGLNLLAGAANGQWKQQIPRALVGLGGGFIGGALAAGVGNLIFVVSSWILGSGASIPNLSFAAIMLRAVGWTVMGLGIGCVDGIYDRSMRKIRNGLIGGGIGGFLGGLLFNPIHAGIGGAMSSRATAFVILGLFIGLFIGLAHVILKEAWLTVLAGFRPGRQLILDRPETWLGTSEKSQLPFIAFGAKGVEPIHLRILRRDDGSFVLQDNNSRTGTLVNGVRAQAPVLLQNGDMIQLGPNVVRFSESFRRADREAQPVLATATGARPVPQPSEAVAVGAPPVPPTASPAGHMRPAARPPLAGIPVSKPAAPPPARQAPPPASPRASPTPVRSGPPPATPPIAPSSPSAPASAACPICARPAKGPPGKRICENCGIRF